MDTRLDGDARIVTFANGMVARELLVDVDEKTRRLVYAIVHGRPTHYNGAVQVLTEDDGHSRLVWIVDLLPNDLAEPIGSMMEQGAAVMKHTLEGRTARR